MPPDTSVVRWRYLGATNRRINIATHTKRSWGRAVSCRSPGMRSQVTAADHRADLRRKRQIARTAWTSLRDLLRPAIRNPIPWREQKVHPSDTINQVETGLAPKHPVRKQSAREDLSAQTPVLPLVLLVRSAQCCRDNEIRRTYPVVDEKRAWRESRGGSPRTWWRKAVASPPPSWNATDGVSPAMEPMLLHGCITPTSPLTYLSPGGGTGGRSSQLCHGQQRHRINLDLLLEQPLPGRTRRRNTTAKGQIIAKPKLQGSRLFIFPRPEVNLAPSSACPALVYLGTIDRRKHLHRGGPALNLFRLLSYQRYEGSLIHCDSGLGRGEHQPRVDQHVGFVAQVESEAPAAPAQVQAGGRAQTILSDQHQVNRDIDGEM
ncbi:unnamed protein product [Diplocarpon coronariae]